MGYPKFPGRSYVLRSSCYVTVKQKNCTSRYCAAAAAAATSIYAATLRAEDVPQISVNWGQKVGRNSRFEQHAEVFTGELENWHVNTLSKTESMGIGHNYRSKQFLSTLELTKETRSLDLSRVRRYFQKKVGQRQIRQTDRQTETDRQIGRQTDRQTDIGFVASSPITSPIIIRDILKFNKKFTNSISHFWEKCKYAKK